MKLVLIRHARVLVRWKKRYDSQGYDQENAHYDRAAVEPLPPMDIPIQKVYVSTLPRSAATAAFLLGEKRIEATPLLDEVPIRSFRDTGHRLPTWFWNFMATLQWHLNHPRQRETRNTTDAKIKTFLDKVEAAGEDCIVVGHGIHFYRMMRQMQARGYKGEIKRYMRNGEIMGFELDTPWQAGQPRD